MKILLPLLRQVKTDPVLNQISYDKIFTSNNFKFYFTEKNGENSECTRSPVLIGDQGWQHFLLHWHKCITFYNWRN